MRWPWKRRRTEQQNEEGQSFFQAHELDLEEQVIATSNVMAIRDAMNVFLVVIKDHREDGHDCPPYCIPTQLAYFLGVMDDNDLRMMLAVLLKDMVESYLKQAEEA